MAAKGFINGDVQHNQNVMIDTLRACADEADMVIFGEAFLQGFYAATFDPAHDAQIALSQDDGIILEICSAARRYETGISFGFIEKAGGRFYSAQMTIDGGGNIIDVYRRVSPGWKEASAGECYCEGEGFHTFSFMGKTIAVGLCGDLWYDENIEAVKRLRPDAVFWPVYTDFNDEAWNAAEKYEYARQAGRLGTKVLYVNALCRDKAGEEIARGGAALFEGGRIRWEVPSGQEDVLLVRI